MTEYMNYNMTTAMSMIRTIGRFSFSHRMIVSAANIPKNPNTHRRSFLLARRKGRPTLPYQRFPPIEPTVHIVKVISVPCTLSVSIPWRSPCCSCSGVSTDAGARTLSIAVIGFLRRSTSGTEPPFKNSLVRGRSLLQGKVLLVLK